MTRRSLLFSGVALALQKDRLDSAARLIESKTASGEVSAAVLDVRHGATVYRRSFGAAHTPDAVFLLASITKPMTATAVMILADRGELSLKDPVHRYIPEFQGVDREKVQIRHLLSHTSGLPDMLPENDDLRKRHAPLKDFVAGACRTPLLFAPGTQEKYQSMGILLASEILVRITNRSFREFLKTEVFEPLGMHQTSLGLGGRKIADTMQSQVDVHNDWDWNSPYWRDLGAPWGGAHSNTADITKFLDYFATPNDRVLKAGTAAQMIRNQNQGLNEPWGIGWATRGARTAKGCSVKTFGHNGSTGTMAWMDPERDLSFVLLTTRPLALSEKMVIQPAADLVSESLPGAS